MIRILNISIILFNLVFSVQDTIRIATYNVLNYSISNSSDKTNDFRLILEEIDPDILIVQEMINSSGATYFKNSVLNYDGNEYSSSIFVDSYDTDNMLYYKPDKVYLVSSNEIPTQLRSVNEYKLQIHDQVINLYSVHLKASQGTSNSNQRLEEIQTLDDNLDDTVPYIVGGDFNIYNSSEAAYSYMMNQMGLSDPISSPGNWHNNSSFSHIHTQSTRSNQESDGGASGGMDDRFDQLLISDGILVLPNSYTSFGNDGNHYNLSINSGSNSVVSYAVANALHNASDHLPVYMDILVDIPNDFIEGDLNQDTNVNILDIVILVDIVVNLTYDEDDLQVSDFNNDGQLNILDIVSWVNYILS